MVTVALGVMLLPLALFSLVTFGPGFPLLCVAGALIAVGFGQGRDGLVALRRRRGLLLGVSAVVAAMGAMGLGYLVLAGDGVARLSGAALLLGASVVAAWLWLGAGGRPSSPSDTAD